MKAIDFTLNEYVWVKLTDLGKQMWKDYNNIPEMIRLGYELTDEKIEAKKNAEGYWEFQCWQFIEIFGTGIGMGLKAPIELTIKILLEDDRIYK